MKAQAVVCSLRYEIKKKCSFEKRLIGFAGHRSLARQMSNYLSPSCRLLSVSDCKTATMLLHGPRLRAKNVGAAVARQRAVSKSPDQSALASGEAQPDSPLTTMTARLVGDTVLHLVSSSQVQMVCQSINHSAIIHPPQPLVPLRRSQKAPNLIPAPQVHTELPHSLLPHPSSARQAKAGREIPILETIQLRLAHHQHHLAVCQTIQIGFLDRVLPLRQRNRSSIRPTHRPFRRFHHNTHNSFKDHGERSPRPSSCRDTMTCNLRISSGQTREI